MLAVPRVDGRLRATRTGLKRSAELMRERNRAAADRFERREREVELGVDPVDLRGLDERVHHRCHLRAALGARSKMILPSEDDTAERALRTVVVERHIGVGEEDLEALEVLPEVVDRFSEGASGQGSLLKRPLMNLLHDEASACCANPQALIGRLALDLALDAVELGDERERFFALLREALFDLDKLSSSMRPPPDG